MDLHLKIFSKSWLAAHQLQILKEETWGSEALEAVDSVDTAPADGPDGAENTDKSDKAPDSKVIRKSKLTADNTMACRPWLQHNDCSDDQSQPAYRSISAKLSQLVANGQLELLNLASHVIRSTSEEVSPRWLEEIFERIEHDVESVSVFFGDLEQLSPMSFLQFRYHYVVSLLKFYGCNLQRYQTHHGCADGFPTKDVSPAEA